MALPPQGRGRPPGSQNKRTVRFMEILEAEGFEPAKALIECYKEARMTYDNYAVIYAAISEAKEATGNPVPVEDKADKYLKIASDIAKDLASYAYPKLKAVEQTKANPTQDLTPQEKLEAARLMVQILEQEVKTGDQSGTS